MKNDYIRKQKEIIYDAYLVVEVTLAKQDRRAFAMLQRALQFERRNRGYFAAKGVLLDGIYHGVKRHHDVADLYNCTRGYVDAVILGQRFKDYLEQYIIEIKNGLVAFTNLKIS